MSEKQVTVEQDQAAANIAKMAAVAADALTKTAAQAAAAVTQVAADARDNLTPVLVAIARIETKLDIYVNQHTALAEKTEARFTDVWKELDGLKGRVDTSTGYSAGMKAMWALIGALPTGALVAIFGLGIK